jgi:GTP cyclohydrolase II
MSQALLDIQPAAPATIRAVERAIGELRRGLPVRLLVDDGAWLVQAAELVEPEDLDSLRRPAKEAPCLLVTGRRAAALGLAVAAEDPLALEIAGLSAATVRELADPTSGRRGVINGLPPRRPLSLDLGRAVIDLMKLARLLPAAVAAPAAVADDSDLLSVSGADVALYRFAAAGTLRQVSEARVPLHGAEQARVLAFRPSDGGREHLAIVIGEPRPQEAVLARLHSECLTGDLLGSLRCDCGDQLRGAIAAIARAGSGVLLYLAQEGRGIGLVNKLRAYTLQDRGADTLDANEQLGFDADERIYLPAAEMLHLLGFSRVRLLTNNPEKVQALVRCGVAVEERVPHHFPSNDHNEGYLDTKARRFGHLL